MRARAPRTILVAASLLPALAACSGSGPTDPGDRVGGEETVLLSVAPAGGSSEVAVDTVVTVRFSHAMDASMAAYADLHRGGIDGPVVPGEWGWLEETTVLRFTPSEPLAPATGYAIHLGGDMMDGDGHHVDMEEHGPGMGGEWATDAMMTGGGQGGTGMHGGMEPSDHTGGHWDHPTNGTHGMVFIFTTEGTNTDG